MHAWCAKLVLHWDKHTVSSYNIILFNSPRDTRGPTYLNVNNILCLTHHILLSRWCLWCCFALQFIRRSTWTWFTMFWFLPSRSPTGLGLCKKKIQNQLKWKYYAVSRVLPGILGKPGGRLLGADYMANFSPGWNFSTVRGLEFCCDYMTNFSPG